MNNINQLVIEGKITSFNQYDATLEYTRHNAETKTDEVSTFKVLNCVKAWDDKPNAWEYMSKWELPINVRIVGRLTCVAKDERGEACIVAEAMQISMFNNYKGEEADNDKDN